MTHAAPPVLRVRSAPLAGLLVSVLVLLVSLRLLYLLGSSRSTYLVLLGLTLLAAGLFMALQVSLVVRQEVLCVHYPFRLRRKTYVFLLDEVSSIRVRPGLVTSLGICLGARRMVSFVFLSPRPSAMQQFRQWAQMASIHTRKGGSST